MGVLVWRALALAAAPATVRGGGTPSPGYSIVSHEPVQQLVNSRLGASLLVLALALVVGALVGYGVAGLRTVLPSPAGRVAGGVGWLLGVLWTPPVPLAMTFASLVVAGAAGAAGAGRMAILALGLGSAVAVLVAVTVGERWRRRAWLAGALAGVGAVGQGLAASAGALVVLEPLVSQPGVGNLLVQSLVRLDVTAVAAAATTLLVVALMGQLVGRAGGCVRRLAGRSRTIVDAGGIRAGDRARRRGTRHVGRTRTRPRRLVADRQHHNVRRTARWNGPVADAFAWYGRGGPRCVGSAAGGFSGRLADFPR
ncbi:hypothetical protein [Fodinicola feengrottensis]|uniref:hypothetical protein n=1 Tax=Fodinicola feengrottensis TaxID=435914 RepID=UPI0013D41626|nr:hypothetical protein [Fodinicola feengrottensis]